MTALRFEADGCLRVTLQICGLQVIALKLLLTI
jgi:hypothetical protein